MDAPQEPRTTGELLLTGAARFGSAEAVADGDVRLTYQQLLEAALDAARGFLASGVRPGDRVGMWAPNSWRWIVNALGLYLMGAVVVPLNTRFRGMEAREILARVRARVVLVEDGFLGYDYARAALEAVPGEDVGRALDDLEVVDLGGSSGGGGRVHSIDEIWSRGRRLTSEDAQAAAAAVAPHDLSDIIFTSGTTGRPKGVLIRHGPTLDLYRSYGELYGIVEGDRYLVTMPLFHTAGNKAGMVTSLLLGATIVPMAVFDADAAVQLIERERVSVTTGSPTIFYSLLESPLRPQADLRSLRVAATGASVVPVALLERARTELPFERLFTAYGLTETIGTVSMCREGDSDEVISRTNGRPLPGVEVRVVDTSGRQLPHETPGELQVRGYNVTPGYWEDPAATAAAIDPDGWLHTGDLGRLDADGNVIVDDRLKDVFIVGGFNVAPAEVEQTLLRHPAVGEVAVVGVPDERLGEVGRAHVVPRPGHRVDPEELIGWCRERLANFKVPRSVHVASDLPRNASGKVLKHRLLEGEG